MAKYIGNFSDFVDQEVKRLSKKDSLTESEKEAISNLKKSKQGKKFVKNTKNIKNKNKSHGKGKQSKKRKQ